jgi:hypothetical protein
MPSNFVQELTKNQKKHARRAAKRAEQRMKIRAERKCGRNRAEKKGNDAPVNPFDINQLTTVQQFTAFAFLTQRLEPLVYQDSGPR